MAKNENKPSGHFTIERIFDAPRKMVWKAWTDPKRALSL